MREQLTDSEKPGDVSHGTRSKTSAAVAMNPGLHAKVPRSFVVR